MKKLITVTLFILIIAIAAWIGYYLFYKDGLGLNSEKMVKACQLNDGIWLKKYKECEYAEEEWCLELGGEYDECASACRHKPNSLTPCIAECIPLCKF